MKINGIFYWTKNGHFEMLSLEDGLKELREGSYKNKIVKGQITALKGDLHLYMKASRYLPSREFFSRRFPTEYKNFLALEEI